MPPTMGGPTESMTMTDYPIIADNVVGPPPDRHAERVVGEMLRWLLVEYNQTTERVNGLLDVDKMGSPTAQRRVFERVKRAFGPLVFRHELEEGKRGRFRVAIYDWAVWDAAGHRFVEGDAPMPAAAALACVFTHYVGTGRQRCDKRVVAYLIVTRHAAVRLAQRCAVRDAHDLLAQACALSTRAANMVVALKDDEWSKPPPSGWRLPVYRVSPGPDGAVEGREALAGVAVLTVDGVSKRLIVKTVLEPHMDANAALVAAVGAGLDADALRRAAGL